jgi:RNase P/RNase MRP subunit POP5
MLFCSILEGDKLDEIDPKRIKFTIDGMLKNVFGVVGASECEFDILCCRREEKNEPNTAILRARKRLQNIECTQL